MIRRRAGFTLIELLLALILTTVVSGVLVRLLMGDMRFAEDREAWRTARQAARSGLTVLTADLRMLETGAGVEAAAAGGQDITVRIPYAFGVLCSTTGTSSTVTLLPVDSLMFAQPGHSGFAWRDDIPKTYTYVPSSLVTLGAPSGPCTTSGITVLPGSRIIIVDGLVPATLVKGTVFLLYRRIRYQFKPSVIMPGQTALWRTLLSSGTTEEVAAPFDAGARFRFYVGSGTDPQNAVPSPLSDISGLELAFDGRSDRTPRATSGPKVVQFSTAVFFQNQTQ
ncbi:MAG TPA: prepilin-type N-terminal cleavage/methylation domain-containing protein [Gemmatimonadales bacterium]